MKEYLDIVDKILTEGEYNPNRTGIGAYTIAGAMFQHDMSKGFPLLTTKKMPFKTMAVELEFFIKGLTDKKWLQDRKCYIWDEWASSDIILDDLQNTYMGYGSGDVVQLSPEENMGVVLSRMWNNYRKEYRNEKGEIMLTPKMISAIEDIKSSGYFKYPEKMFLDHPIDFFADHRKSPSLDGTLAKKWDEELINKIVKIGQLMGRDLGPIYGWQWRHFGAEYGRYDNDYTGRGIDQLDNLVEKLEKNPNDRRMIVTAWNPKDIIKMGLPACHYGFQVTVINDKINLLWNQRSVDTMLGLPFNIASYGLLLHLLAKQSGFKEGKLTGFLADVHIYENQVEGAKEQMTRSTYKYKLPTITTDNFKSIFDWEYKDSKIDNYESYPKIDFGKVAV
jgi:thymidylate synthase